MEELPSNYIVGNDTSYQREYNPVDTVVAFHGLPRFSHHDDFSALFAEEPEEVKSYTSGLLFVACFIMSAFTAWGLLILLFKCLGPFRVGVFSGFPYQRDGWASRTGRGLFLFSGVMIMIFSILTVTKGLSELQNTTDIIDATNQDVTKIHVEFTDLTNKLQTVASTATPIRDKLVDFLNDDICPLVPGTADNDSFRQLGQQTLIALNELSTFISEELNLVEKALNQLAHGTEQVGTAVDRLEFTSGAIVGIMIPYFIVPAMLLVALFMGWTETFVESYFCFTEWFTMPFFTILIMFSYTSCAFVVLGTEGNADFCSGGVESTPENTILNILGRQNLTEGEMYYDAIKFYSHQCTVDGPWGFLEDYHNDLLEAHSGLTGMDKAIMEVTAENMSQRCGVDYISTVELITQLHSHTQILAETTMRTLELLSCKAIVPLYTNSVYDATCQSNMTAATWIFACSFIISFFGMIMIMFRGAYFPLFIWEEKDEYSTASDEDDAVLEEVVTEDQGSEYVDQEGETASYIQEEEEGEGTAGESAYDASTYEESQYSRK